MFKDVMQIVNYVARYNEVIKMIELYNNGTDLTAEKVIELKNEKVKMDNNLKYLIDKGFITLQIDVFNYNNVKYIAYKKLYANKQYFYFN